MSFFIAHFWIFPILFLHFLFLPTQGRLSSYTSVSRISLPPSSAPEIAPEPQAISPSPEADSLAKTTVYDVRSFGAVGDGDSDETQAFKLAWDTACRTEEPSILVVPRGHTFMIQSTIFTGPCRSSSLTFHVMLKIKLKEQALFFLRWFFFFSFLLFRN